MLIRFKKFKTLNKPPKLTKYLYLQKDKKILFFIQFLIFKQYQDLILLHII